MTCRSLSSSRNALISSGCIRLTRYVYIRSETRNLHMHAPSPESIALSTAARISENSFSRHGNGLDSVIVWNEAGARVPSDLVEGSLLMALLARNGLDFLDGVTLPAIIRESIKYYFIRILI